MSKLWQFVSKKNIMKNYEQIMAIRFQEKQSMVFLLKLIAVIDP